MGVGGKEGAVPAPPSSPPSPHLSRWLPTAHTTGCHCTVRADTVPGAHVRAGCGLSLKATLSVHRGPGEQTSDSRRVALGLASPQVDIGPTGVRSSVMVCADGEGRPELSVMSVKVPARALLAGGLPRSRRAPGQCQVAVLGPAGGGTELGGLAVHVPRWKAGQVPHLTCLLAAGRAAWRVMPPPS